MNLFIYNNVATIVRDFASCEFKTSGNYNNDCAHRRGLAWQILEYADEDGFSPILSWLIDSPVEHGSKRSGLEIGFLLQLSRPIARIGTSGRPPLTQCNA